MNGHVTYADDGEAEKYFESLKEQIGQDTLEPTINHETDRKESVESNPVFDAESPEEHIQKTENQTQTNKTVSGTVVETVDETPITASPPKLIIPSISIEEHR